MRRRLRCRYQDALEAMAALPTWPEVRPSEMTGRHVIRQEIDK